MSGEGLEQQDGSRVSVTDPVAEPLPSARSAPGSSRLARLKRRGLRVVVWLRRHPWLIASFGFVSGVLSFDLVEDACQGLIQHVTRHIKDRQQT